MTKLCPRGKAAAKRKFKVYPSAYANAYASKICAGKIKDPSGTKRKDFKGPKPTSAKEGMMTEIEKERKSRDDKLNKIEKERKARKNRIKQSKTHKFYIDPPYAQHDGYGPEIKPENSRIGRQLKVGNYKRKVKEKETIDKFKGKLKNLFKKDKDIATNQVKQLLKFGKETGGRLSVSDVEKLMDAMPKYNVGGHSVMGSPVSVDVDGDVLSNPSASAYYKDLLK